MPTVAELLKTTSAADVKEPPKFPAAHYVLKIIGYDMMPFSWKNSGAHGLSYVPTVKVISCVELDDDSEPEAQAAIAKELEAYGDWANKTFQFKYKNRDTGADMAQVSRINFPLLASDADHENVEGIMESQAYRFYLQKDGEESGFVADVLGLTFDENTPLGEVIEATVDKRFLAQIVWEPNSDPTRPANLAFDTVTAAP